MADLTERQQAILKLVVNDYIRSAMPVASHALLKSYRLDISSATIRNDMAYLEEAGYISHPHTSAGRVPTDRGYRYFVEWLMDNADLAESQKSEIRMQFTEAERDVSEWTKLAASILAKAVQTASVVTLPAAPQCKVKHIDIISVQDTLALLVIVLAEGNVRQQLLTLPELVGEDELDHMSHSLTSLFRGRTADQINLHAAPLSSVEALVKESIVRLMTQIDAQRYSKVYLDGIVAMLGQPEFARLDKTRQVLEMLHSEGLVTKVMPEPGIGETLKVTIGVENQNEELKDFSVILARYGAGTGVSGILAVLGPTRLPYERAISTVRYTCFVLDQLFKDHFPVV